MEPDGFHGRSQRFSYLIACENARRILDDPLVLQAGQAHLDRFSRGDPCQRDGWTLWQRLLGDGPQAVAAALTDRSAWGDWVRETAPSFGGLPARTRARLLRISTAPLVGDAAPMPRAARSRAQAAAATAPVSAPDSPVPP